MRIRTGLTADAWVDLGPATPRPRGHARRDDAGNAMTIGSMQPFMSYQHPGPKHGGNIAEFNEKRRLHRKTKP